MGVIGAVIGGEEAAGAMVAAAAHAAEGELAAGIGELAVPVDDAGANAAEELLE